MDQIKSYEAPEMEIIIVEDCDVITTSSPLGGSPIDGGDVDNLF